MKLLIKTLLTSFIIIFTLEFIKNRVTSEGFYNTSLFGPFWNPTGSTRNMSYDLRGDVPINHGNVGPWNISSYYPIRNKPLWMVS